MNNKHHMLSLYHLQVQYWAPQAAGAGVTLVMAYLNGNHVPNLLRSRTLIAKLIGTICSVGAGFPMGPEGPMVHIGACLASVITYAQCSEWHAIWGFTHPATGGLSTACRLSRSSGRAQGPPCFASVLRVLCH